MLAASPWPALISVSHWDDAGARDPDDPATLVAQGLDDDEWRALVQRLAVNRPAG